MYKLGIDLGTTTVKVILFSTGITEVAQSSHEYRGLKFENENWAQQDALGWWEGTCKCIKEVLQESGVSGSEIRAIGVSGQGPTFLLLDKDGEPVWDSIIWMDRRSEGECKEIAEIISNEDIFAITGNNIDASFLASKFLWMKKNQPEEYSRATKLLSTNGYINYKLTGEFSCDRTNAAVSLLYDIHNRCWSKEILNKLDIDENLMAPLFNPEDIVGHVKKDIADQLGLAEGIPVVAGTVDAMAGCVEAGVISGGKVFEATGTSSVFAAAFDEVVTHPCLMSAVGLNETNGLMIGAMSTSGASYQWCRNVISNSERNEDAYIEMEKIIEDQAKDPTKIIFLPYMAGERSPIWNSDSRGVFFGLSLGTKRAQLYRAVMEGTSFALRDNIEIAKASGVKIDSIHSVGGCCNSEMWLKIKASIINMPIKMPTVNFGAPGGAAMLTMKAIGEYSSIAEAVEDCVKVDKVVYPVEEWVEHYDKMFKIYKSLYNHTTEDFTALANL